MTDLLGLLGGALDARTIESLGAKVGASPAATSNAVSTAVPLLLGQLQRNAAGGGASGLLSALDRDHDGSVLDDLAGFLGSGPSASGGRALDHIFGGKKETIESAVARSSGLGSGQVQQLLAMLAPLVLGALGKAWNRSPATGGGGLADLLGGAVGQMQKQNSGVGGLLGGLLDADGDGSVVDDLLEKGLGGGSGGGGLGGLLGGLLGGGRR